MLLIVLFIYLKNFNNMKNEIYNVGLSTANLSKLDLCHENKKANS